MTCTCSSSGPFPVYGGGRHHPYCDESLAQHGLERTGRRHTPVGVPTDRVRLHVAMWNMARALGLNWTTVDATRPDHELLEEIGAAVTPALAKAFCDGCLYGMGRGDDPNGWANDL